MLVHVGPPSGRHRRPTPRWLTVTLKESIGYHRKHVIWPRCFRRCDRPTKIVLRGSVESAQYAASQYRDILQAAAITQSMSRKANCWDNAPMESFFGTLKTELVHHCEYRDRDTARRELFAYIEGYYNRARIHSAIGYITPQQAEAEAA